MKNLVFGLIATVLMYNFSLAQEKRTISSSVTTEEYKSLDSDGQRLADFLTAATASLNVLEINGQKYSNYDVDVHFSIDEKSQFKNSIILSQIEIADKSIAKGSCQICGVRTAFSCIAKIRSAFIGQEDYDIHVHNDGGGCYTITW